MKRVARRRTAVHTVAAISAAMLLVAGCGSDSDADSKPARKPVSELKARETKLALADKASLPGWQQVTRNVGSDIYTCMIITENGTCDDITASGVANFVRGPQRTDKWVRFSFNVHSFHHVSSARRLYDALPDHDPLPGGAKMAPLGDESAASYEELSSSTHTTAYIHSKVRVGKTVLWTYVMGSPKAVTPQRAEIAAKLQFDRVQQVYKGQELTTQVKVP